MRPIPLRNDLMAQYRLGHILLALFALLLVADLLWAVIDPANAGLEGTSFLPLYVLSVAITVFAMVALGFVCVSTDPSISPKARRRWIVAMIVFIPTASLVFFVVDWIRRP